MNPRAVIWARVSTEPQADEEEKDSIPTQLEAGRELCAREGWDLIAELVVPGFSSDYYDFHKLAQDARKSNPPILVFDELDRLWQTKGMDILIVRDGSRFARTRSLHAIFVDRTILECGAKIYSFADGMIDERNAGMFHSMSSYRTVAEKDQLKLRKKIGVNKLAERGFPTGNHPIASHREIRDDKGKRLYTEVREEMRSLFDDLEKVLLSGVEWNQIENALSDLGHKAANGKPYPDGKFYVLLHNPYFWGHSGHHYHAQYGLWAFDPDEPCPEKAVIYRNTHTAVYEGVQAERIKSELRRRSQEAAIVVGSARPATPYWHTGLVVCDECKHTLGTARYGKYIRCNKAYAHECDQKMHMRTSKLKAYVDSWLRQMLVTDDLDAFFAAGDADREATLQQLRKTEHQLSTLIDDLNNLVDDRSSARTMEVREIYGRKIDSAETQLEILKADISVLRRRAERNDQGATRKRGVQELTTIGIDRFWDLPPHRINQILHELLGIWRFRMRAGEIKGRIIYRYPRKR